MGCGASRAGAAGTRTSDADADAAPLYSRDDLATYRAARARAEAAEEAAQVGALRSALRRPSHQNGPAIRRVLKLDLRSVAPGDAEGGAAAALVRVRVKALASPGRARSL